MTAPEVANLPHYVYEFIGRDGQHLYVGCTCNLGQRLKQHHARDWWSEVVRVEVDLYPNQRAGLDAERALIEQYQPTHNHVFTETHDAGGWRGRRAKMAAAHDAGKLCLDRTCTTCPAKAHALGVKCAEYSNNCATCSGYLPLEFLDDQQETDSWRELARRYGPRRASDMCWLDSAVDVLVGDITPVPVVAQPDRVAS